MIKTFKLNYHKFLFKFVKTVEPDTTIDNIISFNNKIIPVKANELMIRKFPRNDLKIISSVECFVDFEDKNHKEIVISSKNIRAFVNVKEKDVCALCTKKTHCKFFEQTPQDSKASIVDLHYVLNGMFNFTNGNQSARTNEQDKIELDSQLWTSANRIVEIINETSDDLVNYNGVMFNAMIDSLLAIKEEKDKVKVLLQKELDDTEEKLTDPMFVLLEGLKKCKNRKEKRRLLAKHNKETKLYVKVEEENEQRL